MPKNPIYPTEDELRAALLARADEFTKLTGMTRTQIGLEAVNDGAFLGQVEKDRNFGIKLYSRFMSWLDDHWPEPAAKTTKKSARSPA